MGSPREIVIRSLDNIKRAALDSMIFIYHLEDRRPQSDATTALFETGERAKIRFSTSVLTLTEVLTGYRKMRDQKSESAFFEMVRQMSSALEVIPMDGAIADYAATLRAKYRLRTPDAIHFATASVSGAEVYITNDRKLKSVKDLPVLLLSELV